MDTLQIHILIVVYYYIKSLTDHQTVCDFIVFIESSELISTYWLHFILVAYLNTVFCIASINNRVRSPQTKILLSCFEKEC